MTPSKVCGMSDGTPAERPATAVSSVAGQPSPGPAGGFGPGTAPTRPWWRDREDPNGWDIHDDEGDDLMDRDPATWALRLEDNQPLIASQWDDEWRDW